MSARAASGCRSRSRASSRVERDRVVAGICAGVGEALAVDATLVRLTFAFLAFASGAGIVAYLGAWALLPAPGGRRRRADAGSSERCCSPGRRSSRCAASGSPTPSSGRSRSSRAGVAVGTGAASLGLRERPAQVIAVVLLVAGVVLFVSQNTTGRPSSFVAPGAVAVALLLVVGPWAWRLTRERDAEHAERVRTEERADLAARVHDSVLQTLTLIQKDPGDARRLARRQERELRAWLYPDREPAAEGTLAGAVESAAAEVEELHGVRVEVVRTGDAPLDEPAQALALAAREAMVNAARHAGVDEVSVFLDAGDGRVSLYVRDRGIGFDPETVAPDRRGVAESIRGRMERVGGTARIVSTPGEGTEVELELS